MPEKETRKQRQRRMMREFLNHTLSSPTLAEAARKTGVNPKTSSRWLRSPEFRDVFVESRRATFENLADMLRSVSIGAAETLGTVLKDGDAPATPRVAASKTILDALLKVHEAKELAARVDRLEALLAASQGDE